jgi:DNA-binding CsgD family transcriptional regulator
VPVDVVGREEELAALRRLLDDASGGPVLLVLEGEPGIGKTVLWQAGVEEAQRRGFRTLVARPAAAERGLAHAGLGDLLEPVREQVLPGLPAPRRRALEVALLLDEPRGADEVDPRALGLAVADALQSLADAAPLVVAIDDSQWLDASSAGVVAFALRRVSGPVAVLLARRRDESDRRRNAIEQAVDEARIRRIGVGPLSVGALHRLLSERSGRMFGRRTLLRIHEHAGGNPFFALELLRVLASDVDPLRPLRAPETVEELVHGRIADLPEATREALAYVAAIGTAPEALLERAGQTGAALAPAVDAGILERGDNAVRFAHPLLASVLYASLDDRRERVHARIAELVDEPLVRARHLALSRETPDEAVAALLDNTARLARSRGASQIAAELAEQAWRLTPVAARSKRHRRALAAARAEHDAGEWTRAQAIAEGLLAEADAADLHADALVLLAELASVDDAVALLERALAEAVARPTLQVSIRCRLAWATRFRDGYVRALEHARAALELAEGLDDAELQRRARTVHAILGWMVGSEESSPLTVADLDLADVLGGERLVQEATLALVNPAASSAARDMVRAALEREHEEWLGRDEPRAARAIWCLSWVELWAGELEAAAVHAARAHEISSQYGLEVPQDHLPIALVALRLGRLADARAHSERALELARAQFGLHPPQHVAVLADVAFQNGDLVAAAAGLEEADRQAARLGWGEPTIRWWSDDRVEVLLALGRIDEAAQVLDAWQADAERLGRDWVLAQARRCRGLLAAARGQVDTAIVSLERSVAEHEAVSDPFGHARALLALGVVRRRDRQKRPAREAIEEALQEFEAIGAAGWAARARGELGRLSGRRRQEGLTAAERRVADLVADGWTNREIAATLFLAERTVASHLTHIYAKLGVRSRTELAKLHVREPT